MKEKLKQSRLKGWRYREGRIEKEENAKGCVGTKGSRNSSTCQCERSIINVSQERRNNYRTEVGGGEGRQNRTVQIRTLHTSRQLHGQNIVSLFM